MTFHSGRWSLSWDVGTVNGSRLFCWRRYSIGNCCVVRGDQQPHRERPVLREWSADRVSDILGGFSTEIIIGHGMRRWHVLERECSWPFLKANSGKTEEDHGNLPWLHRYVRVKATSAVFTSLSNEFDIFYYQRNIPNSGFS